MNDIKKKSIVLSVIVMLMGLMIVGGTYAYLTAQANITNTNYIGVSTCFLVDYDIDNGDGTQNITGTLFPSISPVSGLNGRTGLKVKAECEVNGTGTLKLHINNGTSASLMQKATSHCEDKKTGDVLTEYSTEASCSSANQKWRNYPASYCEDKDTLQTLKDYTTSASCTANNGTWVTNGSPLKYAVYNTNNTNGSPVRVGHITSSNIGNDITIYDDIILTHDQRYFYVYIWIDGYLTDNSHADLPFDGYIFASATQNDRLLPSEYEQVEWLGSTGTQYIDTGYIPNKDTSVELYFNALVSSRQDYFGTSTISDEYCYGLYDGVSKVYDNFNDDKMIYNGNFLGTMTITKNKNVTTITGDYNLSYTHSVTTFTAGHSLYLFARWKTTGAYRPATMNCYEFKIWDDNNLVRDFIPCYNKNSGVRGLYDTVEGKFYTNAGTGTFEIPT